MLTHHKSVPSVRKWHWITPPIAVGLLATTAHAELVQISMLSYGMLPGGQMRVILADGRGIILTPGEYTFLDGRLYVDTASLARVQATPAAVQISDSGYGYAGPLFNDPVVTQQGANNQTFIDGAMDFVVSPPVLVGGGAILLGAGAVGLADLFNWTKNNDDRDDDPDDQILTANNSIPSVTVAEGTTAGHIVASSLDSYFTNAEGRLDYSVAVLNASGATVTGIVGLSGGQIVTLNEADDANAGIYSVTLTAVDAEDQDRAVQNFSVLFEAEDSAPTVDQGIDNFSIQEESQFTYTIPSTAFFDDEGSLTFSASPLPTGVSFDENTGIFSGTAAVGGTTSITVTAIDSADQRVTTSFDLEIIPVNDAPKLTNETTNPFVFDDIGGQSINTGDPFQLNLMSIVDDEEGDALTFLATSGLLAGYSLSESGTLSGNAASEDTTVLVTVTDGQGGTLNFGVTIDVTGTTSNSAPTLDGSPTLAQNAGGEPLAQGDVIYFDLNNIVSDTDNDTLVFSSSNIDDVTGINLTSDGVIYGNAGEEDTTVQVTVADGNGGTLNFGIMIDVTEMTSNSAPTLDGSPTLAQNAGGEPLAQGDVIYFDLNNIVSDPDNDTLVFSSSNIDDVTGINLTSSGVIYGNAGEEDNSIAIQVTDPDMAILEFTLSIDVTGGM